MNRKTFYRTMCSFEPNQNFETFHENWKKCFTSYLKSLKIGYSNRAIEDLFYNFDMLNWKDLHKGNTEYKDNSKEELLGFFCSETKYICDRMSYDRLFRTHWLFKQVFQNQLNEIKYGRTIFTIEN